MKGSNKWFHVFGDEIIVFVTCSRFVTNRTAQIRTLNLFSVLLSGVFTLNFVDSHFDSDY